jgi:hypothetical protein
MKIKVGKTTTSQVSKPLGMPAQGNLQIRASQDNITSSAVFTTPFAKGGYRDSVE